MMKDLPMQMERLCKKGSSCYAELPKGEMINLSVDGKSSDKPARQ